MRSFLATPFSTSKEVPEFIILLGSLRIMHSGSPPLKRPEAAIPLVFPGESHFRAPAVRLAWQLKAQRLRVPNPRTHNLGAEIGG